MDRICPEKNSSGATGAHLGAGRVVHELERRPAVRDLPEDVRKEQECRDRRRDPWPAGFQKPPVRGEQHAEPDAAREPEHAPLVEQPETDHDPERDPPPEPAATEYSRDQRGAHRPEQQLEDVHGVELADAQVERRDDHGRHRQRLAETRRAHGARDPARQEHGCRARERRQHPDRRQRIAEEHAPPLEERDRQRRLVDVAPGQMVAARDVVELVAKPAVARADPQVDRELRRRERAPEDQARAQRRDALRGVRGARRGRGGSGRRVGPGAAGTGPCVRVGSRFETTHGSPPFGTVRECRPCARSSPPPPESMVHA